MKKTISSLGLMALCFAPHVFAFESRDIHSTFGLDAQWQSLKLAPHYGKDLFTKNSMQGNAYIGAQIKDCLGIQLGYDFGKKHTKNIFLQPGQSGLGHIAGPTSESYQTTAKISGWHLDLIVLTPSLVADEQTQLYAGIGVSQKKVKLTADNIALNGIALLPADVLNSRRTLEKRKSILRLTGGVQHMLVDNWGLRANVVWENTARFKNLKSKENPQGITTANLKNTLSYGLGVFYNF